MNEAAISNFPIVRELKAQQLNEETKALRSKFKSIETDCADVKLRLAQEQKHMMKLLAKLSAERESILNLTSRIGNMKQNLLVSRVVPRHLIPSTVPNPELNPDLITALDELEADESMSSSVLMHCATLLEIEHCYHQLTHWYEHLFPDRSTSPTLLALDSSNDEWHALAGTVGDVMAHFPDLFESMHSSQTFPSTTIDAAMLKRIRMIAAGALDFSAFSIASMFREFSKPELCQFSDVKLARQLVSDFDAPQQIQLPQFLELSDEQLEKEHQLEEIKLVHQMENETIEKRCEELRAEKRQILSELERINSQIKARRGVQTTRSLLSQMS